MKDKKDMEKPKEVAFNEPKKLKFGAIQPDIDGHTVGMQVGDKIDFNEKGEFITGILMRKEQLSIKDDPWIYCVNNTDGDYWFYGSTILNDRLKSVEIGTILTVKYDKRVTSGAHKDGYKLFIVTVYSQDERFDPLIHTVHQTQEGGEIAYFERPTYLPKTQMTQNTEKL